MEFDVFGSNFMKFSIFLNLQCIENFVNDADAFIARLAVSIVVNETIVLRLATNKLHQLRNFDIHSLTAVANWLQHLRLILKKLFPV